MVLTLIARSPRGPGSFAPVAARNQVSRDLTPASGCQDHTPSRPPQRRPSARKLARVARASIATRLTFGDDWPKRPLPSRRDAHTILLICGSRKGKYFFKRGWTRFSPDDPSGKSVWKNTRPLSAGACTHRSWPCAGHGAFDVRYPHHGSREAYIAGLLRWAKGDIAGLA